MTYFPPLYSDDVEYLLKHRRDDRQNLFATGKTGTI
jgi:hypothetical protein